MWDYFISFSFWVKQRHSQSKHEQDTIFIWTARTDLHHAHRVHSVPKDKTFDYLLSTFIPLQTVHTASVALLKQMMLSQKKI